MCGEIGGQEQFDNKIEAWTVAKTMHIGVITKYVFEKVYWSVVANSADKKIGHSNLINRKYYIRILHKCTNYIY